MKTKTSKIIFISYFSFIASLFVIFTIMGFANNNINRFSSFEKTETQLDTFSHIYVSPDCRVVIEKSDSTKLIHQYPDSEEFIETSHEIKNDTLFIQKTNKRISTRIQADNIKSVSGDKCNVNITKLKQEALDVNIVNSSHVSLYEDIKLDTLNMNLSSSSRFNSSTGKIENLVLNVNNSYVYLQTKMELTLIKGQILNNSTVSTPISKKIQIESDSTSTFRLFPYN